VRIRNPYTGQTRHTLPGHTDQVLALAATKDGTRLVSAGDDQTVRIWDLMAQRCIASLRTGHPLSHVSIHEELILVAGERGPYFLTLNGALGATKV
jgi:WD40 repeat protein